MLPPGKNLPRERPRRIILGRVISGKGLAVFTRQLATLVRAGLPLLRALEVLARQGRKAGFQEVLRGLVETIRAGGSFSDGLRRHPKVFDRLYVSMVQAGEAGGVLALVLERLAAHLEKSDRLRGRLLSALTYPVIILIVAVSMVSALMVFVVPRFQDIFAGVLRGQPMPSLTQAVIDASYYVHTHALVMLTLPMALWFAFRVVRSTQRGAQAIDRLLLRLPLLGDLLLKTSVARFARTGGTLLGGGVPVLQVLVIAGNTAGNHHIAASIQAAHGRVKAGEGVARALVAVRVFPDMVTSMIEVGEETGALPEMLGRVADTYEEEVDRAVAALLTLLEPAMIVVMALVVGVIVIALFLPIIQVIQSLS